MYSIDGVALQNPTYGWRFKLSSEPWVSRGIDRPDFNASNRDGTIAVRGHVTTPALTIVARAPGSTVEQLRRLLRLGTAFSLTADPSKTLNVQIVTLTHQTITPAGAGIHELTAVYRVAPDVWWRDVATTDWTANLAVQGQGAANMTVLDRTSGHVTDALIVVSGGVNNLRLTGVNGTWMEYDANLNGQWARFDATRGQVYVGSIGDGQDVWSQGLDSGSALNTGAYPYFLELQPASTGAAACTLGLSWTAVTAATTVTLRARNAYDL